DLLRRQVLNEGHGMRVYAVNRLSDHVQQSYWQLRWESWLLCGFGVVALLLAAFGLYGLTSYSTALRTKEFGVRMALGAQPADVFRLVVREGLVLALTGVGIGLVVSLSVTPVLAAFLFGMQATAALVYTCIAALLLAVAGAACYLPARRSASVERSITLRYE
ncbi:MAG: FtsX-like permease family protein, partial [Bryobacteraceae bacterium]